MVIHYRRVIPFRHQSQIDCFTADGVIDASGKGAVRCVVGTQNIAVHFTTSPIILSHSVAGIALHTDVPEIYHLKLIQVFPDNSGYADSLEAYVYCIRSLVYYFHKITNKKPGFRIHRQNNSIPSPRRYPQTTISSV